ncbi:ATP-binding protein [soil metagenome]
MRRLRWEETIADMFSVFPIVALLGPRQCGKTTLARDYASQQGDFTPTSAFDLEDLVDVARLSEPRLALSEREGLVVLDEIQLMPELFSLLRVMADRRPNPARFLILGSASPHLIRGASESLAGRVGMLGLTPFDAREVDELPRLWLRGGYPRSYLAQNDRTSAQWREAYVRTFLERDLPAFGIDLPSNRIRRFWTMLAHLHGGIFNASELGGSLGVSHPTVRRYLDILTGTFMVRELAPFHENIGKRQVKAPKIYIRDSGLLHRLLGLDSMDALESHPKLGASWEGFALEETIRAHEARPEECFFWATHGGAELDLLIEKDGRRLGFEFKRADAPRLTRSMRVALDDLKLDSLTVVAPHVPEYPLGERIVVRSLASLTALPDRGDFRAI